MDGKLVYVNTDIKAGNLLFSYFQLNVVVNHDVMNCTTQSSKYDLACISLQFSEEL